MDGNFLSGGIPELTEAKEAVSHATQLQDAFHAAAAAVSAKEKEFESQKKYVSDKISSAIKERRNTLKKTHDEQVDAANKSLREAEKKRKAAKTDAVEARVADETKDLNAVNAALNNEAKAILKQHGMPTFCNSSWYYALFAPKRGTDFLFFVIAIIIAFGVIPNIVCLLIHADQWIVKALVYLAIVVFFVGLYFIIFAISKRNKGGEALELVRAKRDEMRRNNKSIKKTSKTIRHDKDESQYGLEGYDAEITNLQNVVGEKMSQRDAALKVFDEQTAVQIREEIQNENQPTIDKLEEEVNVCRQELQAAQAQAEQAAEMVTNNYEIYLGKKNTSVEKIDAMIALIQEGKAPTIMKAVDVMNGEIK